ncbi:MAG TPA: C25 family cysteine peptidase, partial [Thermoanaerobaculia bacterium]
TVTDVRAVDVTDAGNPIALAVKLKDGNATVSAPDGQQRTILIAGASRIAAPAQIVVNQPSTWNDNKQAAQLVIITNRAFLDAASALKKAREAEGISTAVIDVQNLYDEFTYGHHGPAAIRAFLQRSQSWKVAPKYAILLGDASFDPRNYYGMGAGLDYVPTKLVPTAYLKTASDDWFADFDDDGIPSIAIGRIPVRTAAEANAAVAKLIRRGSAPVSADWARNVDFVIDRPTGGIPFATGAAQLTQLVPSSYLVRNVNLATDHPARITDAFTRGTLLMNYLGHGSVEVWSNAFNSWQAANLRNGDKLPFVVAMNCLNGYFHDLFTDSLAEALVRNGNGGAIAVWASSAMTAPHEQTKMNLALYDQLFGATPTTIGEAVMKAKAATQDPDVRKSFVLFGDPTLRLR